MSGFFWAILAAIIWGIVPLIEKLGLNHSDPAVGLFARSLGVLLGMVLLGLLRSPWGTLQQLGWYPVILLALGGFFASIVGQLAFYHALKSGAVSQVTPVAGSFPLIAALLGWWLLREPLTLTRSLGVLCVVVGVILLRA